MSDMRRRVFPKVGSDKQKKGFFVQFIKTRVKVRYTSQGRLLGCRYCCDSGYSQYEDIPVIIVVCAIASDLELYVHQNQRVLSQQYGVGEGNVQ